MIIIIIIIIYLAVCYRNSLADNSTINIIDLDEQRPSGSNFSITCQVTNSDQLAAPQWCRIVYDDSCLLLNRANATFSSDNCTWFSTIMFNNFTNQSQGIYRCFVPDTTLSFESTITVIDPETSGKQ